MHPRTDRNPSNRRQAAPPCHRSQGRHCHCPCSTRPPGPESAEYGAFWWQAEGHQVLAGSAAPLDKSTDTANPNKSCKTTFRPRAARAGRHTCTSCTCLGAILLCCKHAFNRTLYVLCGLIVETPDCKISGGARGTTSAIASPSDGFHASTTFAKEPAQQRREKRSQRVPSRCPRG